MNKMLIRNNSLTRKLARDLSTVNANTNCKCNLSYKIHINNLNKSTKGGN